LGAGADIVTTHSQSAIATGRRAEDETYLRAMERACDEPATG
jgi:putative redox protein